MKYFIYVFLFLNSIFSSLKAQELKKTELDSVFDVLNQAFDFFEKSKVSEAVRLSNEVLEYEKTHKNDSLRALCHNVLGICYADLNDTIASRKYFIKSLEAYKKINDTTRVIALHNNLGVMYRDTHQDIDKSNNYFRQAYTLANLLNNEDVIVFPAFNIAVNLLLKADETKKEVDYKKALPYLLKVLHSEKLKNNEKSRYLKGAVFAKLAYYYHKLLDFEKSKKYYNKAIEYANEKGLLQVLSLIYEDQVKLYESDKDYEKANKTLNKLIVINDSIKDLENFERAKQIESAYFVKENKEKLRFSEKEKAIQATLLSKSKAYNILVTIFIGILLLGVYYIFKKNKELKLAKDKAENLSRVKSDFYSEISHELRTPLYAVIELSALMLKENVNIKHREYLESLKFSGNHLLSLINNILELNKVESSQEIKIIALEFNLKRLIINIIDSLEYALNNSNNKIHLEYDDRIPYKIVGDSLKLSQVLINLVSNAIKFTNNGNINIIINKIDESLDLIKIYFNVSDDGLGISKEKQGQIFEDFYQEHTKSEKSYKGTGLGLSIAKRIISAMDGEIEIESERGKGASFFFELEFRKSEKSKLSALSSPNWGMLLHGLKILIVDDNKINQMVTKKVLEQLNLASETVDNGKEAIRLVKNKKFDCILMDLHMPGIDGYETAEFIREFNKEIPIIALTAASKHEVKEKIKGSGIDDFILKPFITLGFQETIAKTISNKRSTSIM